MKKFILFLSPLFSFSVSAKSLDKTCEDIGAITVTKQLVIRTQHGTVPVGEPQDFCFLSENERQSLILASTLLSKNASLASTAYRIGPKPVFDTIGERADRAYCGMLGGAYRIGKAVSVGWISDEDSGMSGMCVFADGSMVSTWTLFYKRSNPASTERPDFEPHFQNPIIPVPLW